VIAAFLLTGFQGWLGGRVVANELAAWIVTVHMIVALIIVQLLLYATVRAWKKTSGPLSPVVIALILATMIQIGLGTQVRGAVDVALDSGVARDSALASVGLFDHLHRDAAFIVFAGSLLVALNTRLRWAYVVAILATLQVALGALLAYVSLEPAAQVGHLTLASLLLGAETVLLLLRNPAAQEL
jgi:cytochrome c oxidase assembly protein subunit 15